MKYFTDKSTGEIYAYEQDGSQDSYIQADLVPVDEEEIFSVRRKHSEELLERSWRNSELSRADVELNKAQDGDGVGTVKAWREYRKALRAYPATDGFPNSELRPTAPDVV